MKNIEVVSFQHNLRISYELGHVHASRNLSLSDAERITGGFSKATSITLPYSMTFYVNGEIVYQVESERSAEGDEAEFSEEWGGDRNVLVGYTNASAVYGLPIEDAFDPNLLEVTPQIISINGCQWHGLNVLYDNQELQLRTHCDAQAQYDTFEPKLEELCFVDELGFQVELDADWL